MILCSRRMRTRIMKKKKTANAQRVGVTKFILCRHSLWELKTDEDWRMKSNNWQIYRMKSLETPWEFIGRTVVESRMLLTPNWLIVWARCNTVEQILLLKVMKVLNHRYTASASIISLFVGQLITIWNLFSFTIPSKFDSIEIRIEFVPTRMVGVHSVIDRDTLSSWCRDSSDGWP